MEVLEAHHRVLALHSVAILVEKRVFNIAALSRLANFVADLISVCQVSEAQDSRLLEADVEVLVDRLVLDELSLRACVLDLECELIGQRLHGVSVLDEVDSICYRMLSSIVLSCQQVVVDDVERSQR